ncbi:MAG: Gfo/Idh/MocA family oxidoreductase [Caldilineaceae bacterium]|nr:Gfo/Idh/MocA family oxidoreductase [Caldilineaceae bacterium]
MKLIRLGVIGLGLIWIREHQSSLESLKSLFEPVAFCDVSEQRRAETEAAYPGRPVVSDYRQILAMPDADAVLVLTPIAFNAPVALAALEAGKDVIMEKPIARSVAEGERLIEAAHRAGRRLFVMEQLGYRQADTILAEVIEAGEIGAPVLWARIFHFEADTAQGSMSYASTPWRKSADFPLGTLFDGGIHLIASMGAIFGPPQSVYAKGRKLRPDYGEYDQVSMLFQYANGMTGMLSHSTSLPPTQNHFHVHGVEGIIIVQSERLIVERPGEAQRIVALPTENSRATMWQAIVDAYLQNREPNYTVQKALRDVAILEAVDRSIKANCPVTIPPLMVDN